MEAELENMIALPDEESTDCSMIRQIVEWCPDCKVSRGNLTAKDEVGEDVNYFNMLKNYRFTQRHSSHPYKCECGTKLTPQELV